MVDPLEIAPGLSIPLEELEARTSRSSGPGGQNVNKVETRVTLRFDVAASARFSDEQKALVFERLRTRIDKAGVLSVSSQRHRTQAANREAAALRLAELLAAALELPSPRKAVKPSRRARERRVEAKRQRAGKKQLRSRPAVEPD